MSRRSTTAARRAQPEPTQPDIDRTSDNPRRERRRHRGADRQATDILPRLAKGVPCGKAVGFLLETYEVVV